jgi:RNA polymerase sigma-70 factor (ECF subfamily)
MEISDATLVECCRSGETEVFAELVTRHKQAVFNLAMSMTAHNHVDAGELAQEAFVTAYQKLHHFDSRYSFRNWILTICANQTKNRFRQRMRRQKSEEAFVEQQPATSHGETDRSLDELLRRLPESVRVPVALRHVEGCSYDEIAAILGIGVSAAKMRVKRGVADLAEWLQHQPGSKT